MPLSTGSVAEHLAPGIRDILGTRLSGREAHYSLLYNVESTVRNFEDYLAGTGLPIAVEKPQGVDIQSFDPIEGVTKRLTPVVTALGFEVTEEAWEDDLYANKGSVIREAANNLADSLVERVEIDAHRPFNAEGFDTTFTVLPITTEGFFATTHVPIAGGQGISQNNRPSTNTDLNVTSLRTCFTTFKRYRDDQNKRIPGFVKAASLHIPPELQFVAEELLGSVNRPDTANLVKNVTMGAVSIHVDPYMDDTDSWFVRSPKVQTYFLWRWRPRMDSFDDRRARVSIHVAYQRFSFAPVGWMGWYGSNGA